MQGESPHLSPQMEGQAQGPNPGPDPRVRAGILSIIRDLTHQNASTGSIHLTARKDVD